MSKDFNKPFKFASFKSVSDHNIKKFTKIVQFLKVCGKCKNKDCLAHNQNVWSTFGFGSFNMAESIRKAPCVICGKYLKNVQCAIIYQCRLVGKGQKAKEGDETDSSDDQQEEVGFEYQIKQKDSYLIFGEIQKEIVLWHYLVLKATKQKKKCPQKHSLTQFKTVGSSWTCDKCDKKFSKQEKAESCRECDYDLCFDCI